MLPKKNNVGLNLDQDQTQRILSRQKMAKIVCLSFYSITTLLVGLIVYAFYTGTFSGQLDEAAGIVLLAMILFSIVSVGVMISYIIITIVNYKKIKNEQAPANYLRGEIILGILLIVIAFGPSAMLWALQGYDRATLDSSYQQQQYRFRNTEAPHSTNPQTSIEDWQITDIDKNEKTFDANGLDSLIGVRGRFYVIDKTKITKKGEIVDFGTLKVGQKVRIETPSNNEPVSIEILE